MTTKMMTTLIKKAKDSVAEDEKENDDGKKSENGDLNFETSKNPDSE